MTQVKSWSLRLETENNLPTDRMRINFRLGGGLKRGFRNTQGFRLGFKEGMVSVVVRSVVRQMRVCLCTCVCVCFTEEEETVHQKAGNAPSLSTKILCESGTHHFSIWQLSVFTVNVANRETAQSQPFFPSRYTPEKTLAIVFFSTSFTHT